MAKKTMINAAPQTEAVPLDDSWIGRIHHGDCVQTMSQLPADSVHLVFADPPFNIGYKYDEYDDRLDSEKYLEWSRQWMSQVHRILVSTGAFWLAIGDEYAAELKIEAQKLGFTCRSWVIWYYTFGVHCKFKFTRSHAHLFHFVKNPAVFTFNHMDIRVPSARQLSMAISGLIPRGEFPMTPGFCGRRIFLRALVKTKTPGTFLGWREPFWSEPGFMDVRCRSSFWDASSVPVPMRETWCWTHSPEVPPHWSQRAS